MRVDAGRLVGDGERGVGMGQRDRVLVEAAELLLAEGFCRAICSMIAWVEILIEGTAILSLALKSLTDFTSGLRVMR